MVDWEKVIRSESAEELKEIKLWLFQENMRLENERALLANERAELSGSQDKFLKERIKFRDEMESLNHRMVLEHKRLREENQFFEKKMDILRAGFAQLEDDRKRFNLEKQQFLRETSTSKGTASGEQTNTVSGTVELLFRNANNPLALRKRYRDLVKIFHPDNLFGDEELAQQINREFVRRKREE